MAQAQVATTPSEISKKQYTCSHKHRDILMKALPASRPNLHSLSPQRTQRQRHQTSSKSPKPATHCALYPIGEVPAYDTQQPYVWSVPRLSRPASTFGKLRLRLIPGSGAEDGQPILFGRKCASRLRKPRHQEMVSKT